MTLNDPAPVHLRHASAVPLLWTCLLVLSACASTPPSAPALAAAEAAMLRARTPATAADAPLALQKATDRLAAARAAAAAGDTVRARELSEQTVVDARVAEARADAVRSNRAARESENAARALREELQRKPGQ